MDWLIAIPLWILVSPIILTVVVIVFGVLFILFAVAQQSAKEAIEQKRKTKEHKKTLDLEMK